MQIRGVRASSHCNKAIQGFTTVFLKMTGFIRGFGTQDVPDCHPGLWSVFT
jgi:hypothetical protein